MTVVPAMTRRGAVTSGCPDGETRARFRLLTDHRKPCPNPVHPNYIVI
jgi:hypothetical protein